MRIAIDSRPIVHWDRTGVLVYTEKLIESLSKVDANNDYYLLFSGIRLKPENIKLSVNGNFRKEVIPIPDREFVGKQFMWNYVILPRLFHNKKIDIFHATANHILPLSKKVKKIITIHDLRSIHIQEDILPQDIEKIKTSCKMADIVVTVSEYTRQEVINNFYISPKKVKTVMLGIDDCFKRVNDTILIAQFKEKYKLNKPYFFSLGLLPRKNTKRLLLAYSKFKYKNEFMLVVGGSGARSHWFEEYKEIIKEKKINENVVMLNSVSQEDLAFFYNCAFALVFASLFEGFGLPIVEAFACGTPVITSNVSAMPEVADDAAIFVNPYDEQDIASAMEKIAEDNVLRKNLIEKGFRRARIFSWEKMAKEVLNIYQELAD